MKKIKIALFVLIMIMFCGISSFAFEAKMTLEGDDTIKPNETKVLIVKLDAPEKDGIITGTVQKSDNVTNIQLIETDGWKLDYNKENGKFILDSSEDGHEEILKIKYTVGEGETASITLNEVDYSPMSYGIDDDDIIFKNITKEINIENTSETEKTEEKEEEQEVIKEDENKGEEEIDNKEEIKVEDTKEETKESNSNKIETDKTVSNSKLPSTGTFSFKLVITILTIAILATGVALIWYKKNRI